MITMLLKNRVLLAVSATIALFAGASSAQAKPVKLVPSTHITADFSRPESVAVAPGGNIYVGDRSNNRVQELTPSGTFVLMFGREVNATKTTAVKSKGGTPSQAEIEEENVCTAASGETCKSGVEGSGAEQFAEPFSVAVDPGSGDVYVEEVALRNHRVDKYTGQGRFVWMIGKEVDQTKTEAVKAKGGTPSPTEIEEENICTAASKDACQGGAETPPGSTGHRAFKSLNLAGNLLAVGSAPDRTLYVGDQGRVQEIEPDGTWKGEVSLAGISTNPESLVVALAVDEAGNVYLADRESAVAHPDVIREFDQNGVEVNDGHYPLIVEPRQPGLHVGIAGVALDSEGHLAVTAAEHGVDPVGPFGELFDSVSGRLITEFTLPTNVTGITFNEAGDLYAPVGKVPGEVIEYEPLPVAEVIATSLSCVAGEEHETDVTLACALEGEVNPWGVSETKVWFQWGRTETLSSETAKQPVGDGEVLVPVSSQLSVRPGEGAFYFRLLGEDHNVRSPEKVFSDPVHFATPITAPRIAKVPSASFVSLSSVVLFDELNPENANTEYFFEYGREGALASCPHGVRSESCAGVSTTPPGSSKAYGKIATTVSVTGLQPGASYEYRLSAISENTAKTEKLSAMSGEGTFTTGSTPNQGAATGPAGAVGTTSAIVSGTVSPDGRPASYAFELGAYEGAQTRYGIVFSGTVGASGGAVEEAFALTGLQPDTTYAYRISISSGYVKGTSRTVYGQGMTFTTAAVAAAPLAMPLALLPVPAIAFPKEPVRRPVKKLSRAQRLARALEACKHKPKSRRAACRRSAHKKYPVAKAKKKK